MREDKNVTMFDLEFSFKDHKQKHLVLCQWLSLHEVVK